MFEFPGDPMSFQHESNDIRGYRYLHDQFSEVHRVPGTWSRTGCRRPSGVIKFAIRAASEKKIVSCIIGAQFTGVIKRCRYSSMEHPVFQTQRLPVRVSVLTVEMFRLLRYSPRIISTRLRQSCFGFICASMSVRGIVPFPLFTGPRRINGRVLIT